MGNCSWRSSSRHLDLQGRQTHRQQARLRGRPAARQIDFRCPEAQAAVRGWWICLSTAAVLAVPILGTWPTLAVAGAWLMSRSYHRRR